MATPASRQRVAGATALALLLVLAARRPHAGGDEPAPPTYVEQADAVVAAAKAKDAKALAKLQVEPDPDPWYVVEELCARGEFDAAEAFAKAAPRLDVEKLPGYVAWRRAHPVDRKAWAAVTEALRLAREGPDFAASLAAIEGVEPSGDEVTSIHVGLVRAFDLVQLGRLADAQPLAANAAERAERLGFLARAVKGWRTVGMCAWLGNDPRGALAPWELGLALDRRRRSRPDTGAELNNLSNAYQALGETEKALAYLAESLALARETKDRIGTGTSLLNIGILHRERGDLLRALENLESAWNEFEREGPKASQQVVLFELAAVRREMGELDRALALDERSMKLSEELNDPSLIEQSYIGLANDRVRMGEYAAALALYDRALEIDKGLGERADPAPIYANTGTVYSLLGEPEKALASLGEALAIYETRGDRVKVMTALIDIAASHDAAGRPDEARKALERARELARQGGEKGVEASVTTGLAALEFARGDVEAALKGFGAALELGKTRGDRLGQATALNNIASCRYSLGRHAEALAEFERARTLAVEIGSLSEEVHALVGEAGTLHALRDDRNGIAAARAAVERLPHLVLGLSDESGAAARGEVGDAYEIGATCAAALGDPAEACFFLESGRAGSFLESMKLRRSPGGAAPPRALADAELAARAKEAAAAAAWRRASRSADVKAVAAARAELDRARSEEAALVERIQREAKASASILYPRAAPLAEIQRAVTDGEALVLYGPGATTTLALVVTSKGARVITLGKRADIEAACAALLAHDAPEAAGEKLEAVRSLVLTPLGLDAATKRVLVSPTGVLSYVPMSLLDPTREFAYLPSATTYLLLLDERAKQGSGVLALGDPAYGEGSAASSARGASGLPSLPATRDEAKAVGDVVLLGKDATRARLEAGLLARPRWRAVHLACHGRVDAAHPTLSALALTPTGEHDGFWTSRDIFRTRMSCDLTVLSACETGKGRVYRAEGIVGLTRAVMFAGAPRVIVSLWKVDDRATRLLMEAFYARWKKGGVGAAAALAEAQATLRAFEESVVDPEASRAAGKDVRVKRHPYAAPVYWAAWVLWGLPI